MQTGNHSVRNGKLNAAYLGNIFWQSAAGNSPYDTKISSVNLTIAACSLREDLLSATRLRAYGFLAD